MDYTLAQAAEKLGIGRHRCETLIVTKQLHGYNAGRSDRRKFWRVSDAEIRRFRAEVQAAGKPAAAPAPASAPAPINGQASASAAVSTIPATWIDLRAASALSGTAVNTLNWRLAHGRGGVVGRKDVRGKWFVDPITVLPSREARQLGHAARAAAIVAPTPAEPVATVAGLPGGSARDRVEGITSRLDALQAQVQAIQTTLSQLVAVWA